jgi:decaprenylphospho-beta-D-ribofuranose 2-oxidase
MKEKVYGWGKYPVIDAEVFDVTNKSEVISSIKAISEGICYGKGGSYGDSALSKNIIRTSSMNLFTKFDEETGVMSCQAGMTLEEILDVFVPRGWFLPVVPGTKYITVGGAIASDIHGKNHHIDGTFCDHLESFTLITANEEEMVCSPTKNSEVFHATCGGMGLTGVIVEASIKLRKIKSAYVDECIKKAQNVDQLIDYFEEHKDSTYSAAWVDALAKEGSLGRSILMLGEHVTEGEYLDNFDSKKGLNLSVPIDAPSWTLNPYSIKAFNTAFWTKERKNESQKIVHYEPFFFPLDGVNNWNKLYGKGGFTQYQFVIPFEAGREGLKEILAVIANSGKGSFLAVLKAFGEGNNNYLSFPMAGYTLALDFKLDFEVYELFDRLDAIVNHYGGRIYLAKDVRMSPQTFRKGYPNLDKFLEIREKLGAKGSFASLQSKRLEID